MRKGENCVKELTNVAEFGRGKRVFSVTAEEYAPTPASELLCGNFIEVGFGYQVESMWTRCSTTAALRRCSRLRRGRMTGSAGTIRGWATTGRRRSEYHSAYQHSRWYAFPGKDRPRASRPTRRISPRSRPDTACASPWRRAACTAEHCLVIRQFRQPPRRCGAGRKIPAQRRDVPFQRLAAAALRRERGGGDPVLTARTRAQDEEPLAARGAAVPFRGRAPWVEVDFPPAAFDGWGDVCAVRARRHQGAVRRVLPHRRPLLPRLAARRGGGAPGAQALRDALPRRETSARCICGRTPSARRTAAVPSRA